MLSGSTYNYNPAAPGSNPMHTSSTFSTCNWFVLCKDRKQTKRVRDRHILLTNRKIMLPTIFNFINLNPILFDIWSSIQQLWFSSFHPNNKDDCKGCIRWCHLNPPPRPSEQHLPFIKLKLSPSTSCFVNW